MTTSRENLERFAEGNAARAVIIEEMLDGITMLIGSEDESVAVTAMDSVASIALWDLEVEQREIANLIAVANSALLDPIMRADAERRIATMLGLSE